jgi:hypothetical protein
MNKKTSNYYATYMRALQEMLKKPAAIMEIYASIAANEECQQLFVAHMRVLHI